MARRRKNKANGSARPRRNPIRLNFSWIKMPNRFVLNRALLGCAWVITAGGLFAAWTMGVPRLEASASERASVSPNEVIIRFVNAPPWINGTLGDSLLRTATMHVGGDPLRRDDLAAIRDSLMTTGWFDSINQVRRIEADLVEIDAALVQPYTLIRDKSAFHLVDLAGKLLPKSYGLDDDLPAMLDSRTGLTVPMIAITGVHFKRPAVGQPWEGGDVNAGLKVLRILHHQPWRHQIVEVDVSQYLKDGPIRLRTDTGTVIVWGGPPGDEAALELLADGKIERLNLLYTNHGRVDAGRSGELDITGEKVAVAR
jgi:hypothetical protein